MLHIFAFAVFNKNKGNLYFLFYKMILILKSDYLKNTLILKLKKIKLYL